MLLSFPLAVLAIVTSVIACFALSLRVMLVYIELATAVVSSYVFMSKPIKRRPSRQRSSNRAVRGPWKRRRRRSASSVGSFLENNNKNNPSGIDGTPNDGITPGGLEVDRSSPGSVRDFEGVGGWRFTDHDEEADNPWASLNSRLELPAAPERKRRHRRSFTSGSAPSPQCEMTRPNHRHSLDLSSHVMSNSRTPNTLTTIERHSNPFTSRSGSDFHHPLDFTHRPVLARSSSEYHHRRRDPSSSSSPSSSRTSSLGSPLLMKHSVRD